MAKPVKTTPEEAEQARIDNPDKTLLVEHADGNRWVYRPDKAPLFIGKVHVPSYTNK